MSATNTLFLFQRNSESLLVSQLEDKSIIAGVEQDKSIVAVKEKETRLLVFYDRNFSCSSHLCCSFWNFCR